MQPLVTQVIRENPRREALVRVRLALGYLVLVALLGLVLRWLLVEPIAGLNYRYLLHAHSHVALLGWLYCALFATFVYICNPQTDKQLKSFKLQFWLTQVSVQGMLLSFPVQGYGAISITFSTMHLLLSYWFAWTFWQQVKHDEALWQQHKTALRFLLVSLVFLVLSSLGPWAMGPIMAKGLSGEPVYFNAIYFYLHFQYNGWFTFAVLGLLFWFLESRDISYNRQAANRLLWLLGIACVPAYALSVLWTQPSASWYWVGAAAGLLQVVALGFLLQVLWQARAALAAQLQPWVKGLYGLALASLVLKVAMQAASALPYVADLAYQFRYFVIGYLHLVLIGFVSFFVLGFLVQQRLLKLNNLGKAGLALFIICFGVTEALLFLQATLWWQGQSGLPDFNLTMLVASVGMPLGVLLFFVGQPGLYLYKSAGNAAYMARGKKV